MQYGSPGSPTINFEMWNISTLNVAIRAPFTWSLETSTSTSRLGTSSHNKNFFEAGYHSNEIPLVILG